MKKKVTIAREGEKLRQIIGDIVGNRTSRVEQRWKRVAQYVRRHFDSSGLFVVRPRCVAVKPWSDEEGSRSSRGRGKEGFPRAGNSSTLTFDRVQRAILASAHSYTHAVKARLQNVHSLTLLIFFSDRGARRGKKGGGSCMRGERELH